MDLKKSIIITIILVILSCLLYWLFSHHVDLTNINQKKSQFKLIVKRNYFQGVLYFVAVYLLTHFIVPFSTIFLNFISGYLFGPAVGTILSVACATLGATITFLLFRYLWSDIVYNHYSEQLNKLNMSLKKHGVFYFLLLRLNVLVPFQLITILSAFTKIRLFTFITLTAIGILPATILYAYAGSQFTNISDLNIYSTFLIIFWVVLTVIFGFYHILKRYY